MTHQWYLILHIVGIVMVFMALGGMILRAAEAGETTPKGRKLTGMAHGVGLILLLVSGFGMLAKLKLGFDPWVFGKLAIWLALGGIVVMIRKKPEFASMLFWALPLIGGLAAWLALFKVGA